MTEYVRISGKSWRAQKVQNTVAGYDTTTNPECGSLLTEYGREVCLL